jgi:hypothetical protein
MMKLISFLGIVLLSVNIASAQEMALKREVNKGNVITGACLFGIPWLICVAVALEAGHSASYLPVPIVGPFITNAKDNPSSEGLIVAIGISTAEAIGATLITLGIIGSKKYVGRAMLYPIINNHEYGLALKLHL